MQTWTQHGSNISMSMHTNILPALHPFCKSLQECLMRYLQIGSPCKSCMYTNLWNDVFAATAILSKDSSYFFRIYMFRVKIVFQNVFNDFQALHTYLDWHYIILTYYFTSKFSLVTCKLPLESSNLRECKQSNDHLGFCLHDIQWTGVDSHFAIFGLRNLSLNLALEHHARHCRWRLNTLALTTMTSLQLFVNSVNTG